MKQTRKGNTWYFGMKLHVGTDLQGRVHSVTATHAGVADITQLPQLLHGAEGVLYGDQAYWKEADRQAFEAAGVRYRMNRRAAAPHQPLSAHWRAINRARSRTRARGEHPFHVVKRLWGFAKVRYRGDRQEPGARLQPLRAGEPLPGPAPAVAATGEVRPVSPGMRVGPVPRRSWAAIGRPTLDSPDSSS
jgi:IS5 family transposase